ncbi:dipeptidase [Streptomyces sp. NPDC056638]|uniref:dipeptidase n=1 Tax=Streptomyces sp. NPDC056638 TaxID=3345887 RepID=UPI0036C01A9D
MTTSSIVLMSDRRVTAIPVQERGEVLLDARAHGLMVDDRKQDAAGAWAHVRQGVLTRLQQAQALLPGGVQLLFIEGYRPPSLQRRYFEEYSDELARAHPDWQAAELREAASRFVSPPEIAPHSAGAAVDVISVRARTNRATLGGALSTAGLINYGTDWWHWSFGDRYWALQTQQPAALYGPVELP